MNPAVTDFLLADGQDMEAAAKAVRDHLRCEIEPPMVSQLRYFDSFEWSLYLSGAALEEETAGETSRLTWLDLADGGAVAARQVIDAPVAFVQDLPPGPVRERLAPVLGIRRLLPMVTLASERRTARVLNEDDKTVVRILLEQCAIPVQGTLPEVLLPTRLRLLPVRGYGREFDQSLRQLQRGLQLQPAHAPPLLAALAATDRRPGAYSSKLDYRLDPGQRAEAATRTILLGLLETLEANVDGARQNLDIEFLHDLRVATRRTRSALSQIKGVFPQGPVGDFKDRFAWLQQVTGPVRDLDVYLLDFPKLKADLPASLRAGLDPLKEWLQSHYDGEQQALAQALAGDRFVTLLRDWRAFLDAPIRNDAPDAAAPIKQVADRRIRRMFKRVLREGRAIRDDSPAEDLHELRKTCKKLRYLMEFFQSLYPAAEIKALIKQTKVLLDNLGGFQDLAVQAEHLAETAGAMQAAGAAPLEAQLAMGALISHMLERQQRARREFARIFAGFDTEANGVVFQRLFAPAPDPTATPPHASDLRAGGAAS
jgi:CHAD domain-containing protein